MIFPPLAIGAPTDPELFRFHCQRARTDRGPSRPDPYLFLENRAMPCPRSLPSYRKRTASPSRWLRLPPIDLSPRPRSQSPAAALRIRRSRSDPPRAATRTTPLSPLLTAPLASTPEIPRDLHAPTFLHFNRRRVWSHRAEARRPGRGAAPLTADCHPGGDRHYVNTKDSDPTEVASSTFGGSPFLRDGALGIWQSNSRQRPSPAGPLRSVLRFTISTGPAGQSSRPLHASDPPSLVSGPSQLHTCVTGTSSARIVQYRPGVWAPGVGAGGRRALR